MPSIILASPSQLSDLHLHLASPASPHPTGEGVRFPPLNLSLVLPLPPPYFSSFSIVVPSSPSNPLPHLINNPSWFSLATTPCTAISGQPAQGHSHGYPRSPLKDSWTSIANSQGQEPSTLGIFGAVHSIFPLLEEVCSVGLGLSPAIDAHGSYSR